MSGVYLPNSNRFITSSQINYLRRKGVLPPIEKKTTNKANKKKSYNNWFEKLNITELKSLCRASKLPVSGTKDELCIRLCSGELSRDYAYEYAPERFSRARFEAEMPGYGSCDEFFNNNNAAAASLPPAQQGSKRNTAYSNQELKDMCRNKGLVVSGKRYDLVLRLLQNESGVGGSPKRAAGTINEETGVFQPKKKRAKSMKPPNVDKLQERIFKKCFPSDEVKNKWSNNKYKYHHSDCMVYMSNIIEKEIFEKELFDRGDDEEKCAWELLNVMLHIITVGNETRRKEWVDQHSRNGGGLFAMIGGTDFELNRCSDNLKFKFLPQLVKAMKATSNKTVVAELGGKFLWAFQSRKLGNLFDEYDTRPGDWRTPITYGSFKEILNEFVPLKRESSTEESEKEEEEADEKEPQMRFFSLTKLSGQPMKTQELTYSHTAGFQPVASTQQEGAVPDNGKEITL
jgi:hypothetical protein